MERSEKNKNVKLGLFVTLAIVIFLFSVFYVGSASSFFRKTIDVTVQFRDVQGLRDGNNVWLSGVKVGSVKTVRVTGDSTVTVVFQLRSDQSSYIKKNASAYVSSDGLVGNKILVLIPGDGSREIEDGDSLVAYHGSEAQDMMATVKASGENIIKLTEGLNQIVEGVQAGKGIVGVLLKDTLMTQTAKNALTNLELTSNRTATITGDIAGMVRRMNNNTSGPISTLLTDTSFSEIYHQTLGNFRITSENTAEVTGDFTELMKKAQNENSALGVILTDTSFANNLKRTAENAAYGSKKIAEDAEALQHNFLFRGYFRKKAKEERKNAE